MAEVNGLIYVAGGFGADGVTSERLEAYDPAANRWKRLPPLPVPVNHAAAAGLGSKLYVLGGYQSPQGLAGPNKVVQIYDPARQTWSQGSLLPTARGGLTATVLDGKIYAIGGAGGPSLGTSRSSTPAVASGPSFRRCPPPATTPARRWWTARFTWQAGATSAASP